MRVADSAKGKIPFKDFRAHKHTNHNCRRKMGRKGNLAGNLAFVFDGAENKIKRSDNTAHNKGEQNHFPAKQKSASRHKFNVAAAHTAFCNNGKEEKNTAGGEKSDNPF